MRNPGSRKGRVWARNKWESNGWGKGERWGTGAGDEGGEHRIRGQFTTPGFPEAK